MSERPRVIDMAGETIGRVTVERRAPNPPDGRAAWWCRCACGERFVATGAALRAASRTYACAACRPRGRGVDPKRRAPRQCSLCGHGGHDRSACPNRPLAKPKVCQVCWGVNDRRPAGGCPGCSRPYIGPKEVA